MDKLMALITMLLLALSFDAAGARKVTEAGEAPTVRVSALAEGDIQAPAQSDDLQAPYQNDDLQAPSTGDDVQAPRRDV